MVQPKILEYFQTCLRTIPPALTVGLGIFMFLTLILMTLFPTLELKLRLDPNGLKDLQLSRLSFYPLLHLDFFHFILNYFSLLPFLKAFELTNGTVRTGIVLNLLATICGLIYCFIEIFLGLNTPVIGSSVWVFAFLAYFSYQESLSNPYWNLTSTIRIRTYLLPVIPLIASAILVPGSSLLGHLVGSIGGYILSMGYLRLLIDPSTYIVEKIEKRLERLISLIPSEIQYVSEISARETRDKEDGALLPQTEFPGTGQRLDTPGNGV